MIPTRFNPLGRNAGSPYFEVTIDTTASNLTWAFQCTWNNSGGYCRVADWGDGSREDVTRKNTLIPHTYSGAGRWTVKFIGNVTAWRVTSTYSGLVYDTNANWSALGSDLQSIIFNQCTNAVFNFGTLPAINQFNLWGAYRATCPITRIPDTIGAGSANALSQAFQECQAMPLVIHRLPSSQDWITMQYCFYYCQKATINLDAIAANAPAGGWPACTSLRTAFNAAGSGNSPGTCTGSVAALMRKFPNATNVTNAFGVTNTTPFGTADYCSFTFTTTSANQVWGFTPTSSAGLWYVFDWGDGTTVTYNKNLDVFTSGTRIEHTFATPGTYTVKLAMNASAIALDAYDSTNGKWDMLGNPTH